MDRGEPLIYRRDASVPMDFSAFPIFYAKKKVAMSLATSNPVRVKKAAADDEGEASPKKHYGVSSRPLHKTFSNSLDGQWAGRAFVWDTHGAEVHYEPRRTLWCAESPQSSGRTIKSVWGKCAPLSADLIRPLPPIVPPARTVFGYSACIDALEKS